MKKIKTNIKNLWQDRYRIAVYAIIATTSMGIAVTQAREPLSEMLYIKPVVVIKTVEVKQQMELLKYNDQVPEKLILKEVKSLSKRFGIDELKWNKVLKCESGINNLAQNPNSTAVGLAQYLIRTWYETESWKQFKCARTDYKCTLWEMGLDLKNGEQWRWQECLDITGVRF